MVRKCTTQASDEEAWMSLKGTILCDFASGHLVCYQGCIRHLDECGDVFANFAEILLLARNERLFQTLDPHILHPNAVTCPILRSMLFPHPLWQHNFCLSLLIHQNLGKLLLDKERSQMRQLPRASTGKNNELDNRPSNDTGICGLGLVAELSLSLLQTVSTALTILSYHSVVYTRWKICSLLTSCSLEFSSCTFCVSVCTFSLSVLSILLVSPMAKSSVNLTVPCTPELSQPPPEGTFWGVTQMRCCPESAALNVNLPCDEPRWATMRWLLSNVSSTVTKTPTSGLVW